MFLRHKISYFVIGAIAIVFLAGLLFFDYEKNNAPEAEAAGEAWFDSNWTKRKAITIAENSGANLINYQVKAAISYDSDMQADFDDIRFTDSGGAALIDYWLESKTDSISAVFWIEVPNIPASGATTVYMYYGNVAAASASSVANTFIREISGVQGAWSMDEPAWNNNCSTLTVNDGSGNANHGKSCLNVSGPVGGAGGKFGNGGSFDGADDYVEIADAGSLDSTSQLTLSAWIKTDVIVPNQAIIIKGNSASNPRNYALYLAGDELQFNYFNGGWRFPATPNADMQTGVWYYVVYARDAVNESLYVNGVRLFQQAVPVALVANGNTFRIGVANIASGEIFKGMIDEVRIYNSALSPAEITDLYGSGGDRHGYVTSNYSGKELVRKYSFPEPTTSMGGEEVPPSAGNVRGFAWSENIGWISFNSTNCDPDGDNVTEGGINNVNFPQCPDGVVMNNSYGVSMDNGGRLSGYAWSENIGWITFDKAVAGVPPGAPYNGGQLFMAKKNGSDEFEGWARAVSACKDDLWDGAKCIADGAGNYSAGDRAGGWDGWIKLRKDPADAGANYGVSLNGTDFEGFAWGDMVVGWISFNCLNTGVCATSNYKVYLSAPLNNAPRVDTLVVNSPPSFCIVPPFYAPPTYTFSWNFSDLDGDNQSQARLQIDNNPDFLSTEVDISILGNGSSRQVYIVESAGANQLSYGVTYNWRVMVSDDNATPASSAWIYPPASLVSPGTPFITPDHPYPFIGFAPPEYGTTPSFLVNTPIDFKVLGNANVGPNDNDNTKCYPLAGPNGTDNCDKWEWDFDYDDISFTLDTPPGVINGNDASITHTYTLTKPQYKVVLQVTDKTPIAQGGPFTCSNIGDPGILGATRPKWKEVVPR